MKFTPLITLVSLVVFLSIGQAVFAEDVDKNSKDLIVNGTMEEGTSIPTGWRNWVKPSTSFYAELSRDTENPHDGEASLRIQHETAGYSSTQADLTRTAPRIHVSASVRHEATDVEDLSIGIQCFDENRSQITWLNLAEQSQLAEEWRDFEREFDLPEGTVSWQLAVGFSGQGSVWVDSVSVTAID